MKCKTSKEQPKVVKELNFYYKKIWINLKKLIIGLRARNILYINIKKARSQRTAGGINFFFFY